MYNGEDWVQRDATKELEECRKAAEHYRQAVERYNRSVVVLTISKTYDWVNPPKQPVKLWDWEGIE